VLCHYFDEHLEVATGDLHRGAPCMRVSSRQIKESWDKCIHYIHLLQFCLKLETLWKQGCGLRLYLFTYSLRY
jgi:hypothetical protein